MMKLTSEQVKELVLAAQKGDAAGLEATEAIMWDIQEHHIDRLTWKYRKKITVGGMDHNDLKQEFLTAAYQAIFKAKVDVGDPQQFILQHGKWAVVDALRSGYRKALRQYCHSCNTTTRLHEERGQAVCPNCNAKGDAIERMNMGISDDGTLSGTVADESLDISEVVASQEVIDNFYATLEGRKADVFALIIYQGYDRDSCTNYIKEIAGLLGVSAANVNKRLRQIKEEWAAYTSTITE